MWFYYLLCCSMGVFLASVWRPILIERIRKIKSLLHCYSSNFQYQLHQCMQWIHHILSFDSNASHPCISWRVNFSSAPLQQQSQVQSYFSSQFPSILMPSRFDLLQAVTPSLLLAINTQEKRLGTQTLIFDCFPTIIIQLRVVTCNASLINENYQCHHFPALPLPVVVVAWCSQRQSLLLPSMFFDV